MQKRKDDGTIRESARKHSEFRCEIACLNNSRNKIQIYDISHDIMEMNQEKSIEIRNKDNLFVKISNNFEKVFFCNDSEQYILETELILSPGASIID